MNEVYDKKKVNLWFFSGVKQVKKYAIQLFKSKLHHFFTSYNSKTQAKKMFLLNKYLNWKVDLSTEKDYSQFKSTTQKITLFFMEYDVKTGRFGSHFSTKSCKKNDIFNPKYFVKHCIYNPQQSVHQNAQLFLLKKNFDWCIHHR